MTSFYLRDSRTDVGSTCTFWAKDGNGYTSNLDKAEVYTQELAQHYLNNRHTDVPLSKALVDELATARVDHQYLDESESGLNAGDCEYVIHVKRGDYDGNDIYWKAEKGCTVNLTDALVLTREEAEQAARFLDDAVIYSWLYATSISRRTMQASNINERRMITTAGIRKPKRRRQRPSTGRTRGNCPHCGKVTWGLNSYETYTCAEAVREKHGTRAVWTCEDARDFMCRKRNAA